MNKTSFSKAELKTSFRCGMQHMFRWVEGIKVRPTFAQAASQGARAGLELAYQHHDDMTEEKKWACSFRAKGKVNEVVAEDGIRDPYDMTLDQTHDAREAAITRAARTVEIFVEDLQRDLPEKLTPKQGWKLHVPGIGELTGTFDAIDLWSMPVATRLYYPPIKFDEELLQDPLLVLDAYVGSCLFVETPKGGDESLHGGLNLADIRTKGASSVEKVFPSDEDNERMFDRVEAHVGAIQKGVAVPATHDSWTCNKEYCGYYADICPYGRRNRTQR